jgi:hypothetical protein
MFLSLTRSLRMLRENEITLKHKDTLRCRGDVYGLLIVENIPDTGRAVLRVTRALGVDKVLLAGGVGSQQSSQAVGLNSLVLEQLDKVVT